MLNAGQHWQAGQRVYQYQARGGWLPLNVNPDGHDYDVQAYTQTLLTGYVSRLRKGLSPQDYEQLFRPAQKQGLFDKPVQDMHPVWQVCQVAFAGGL